MAGSAPLGWGRAGEAAHTPGLSDAARHEASTAQQSSTHRTPAFKAMLKHLHLGTALFPPVQMGLQPALLKSFSLRKWGIGRFDWKLRAPSGTLGAPHLAERAVHNHLGGALWQCCQQLLWRVLVPVPCRVVGGSLDVQAHVVLESKSVDRAGEDRGSAQSSASADLLTSSLTSITANLPLQHRDTSELSVGS